MRIDSMYGIKILILTCVFSAQIGAYTTFDGKTVPPLPAPVNPTMCSTTIQLYMALRTQGPNKTIVLKDGAYDIATIEPLRIDSIGVTIRGQSGDPTKVVISGKGFENCDYPDEEMFQLAADSIVFANVTIAESRCHGIKILVDGVDNVRLHNVRFFNIGERCIKGGLGGYGWNIGYCHFENTKVPVNDTCRKDHIDGNYIAGMDIMNSDSWVVHDCLFRNIRGATGGGRGAIFFWGGTDGRQNKNVTVERNTFFGCDRSICFGNFIVRGADNGIEMEHSSSVKIYNNTLYSTNPTFTMAVQFSANDTANEFRNNIIFGNISGSVQTMSNNITKNTAGDANTNWFVSRSDANLHLTGNATQAINQGANGLVADDWDGHARVDATCDVGADEYNSVLVENRPAESEETLTLSIFPNPFNPATAVKFSIAGITKEAVRLAVYDLKGGLVKVLMHRVSGKGPYTVAWDGTDGKGAQVSGGVYVCTLTAGSMVLARKMFLVR